MGWYTWNSRVSRHDPAGPSHGYVQSELIPADIERTVEDAQNIDVSIVLDQIGDAVVAVEEDPHMAARCPIAMAHLRKVS